MTKGKRTRNQSGGSSSEVLTLSMLRSELETFKVSLRDEIIREVKSIIADKFNELNSKIQQHDDEIALLKKHLAESEGRRLREARQELALNVVISGLPESDNETSEQLAKKIDSVFSALDKVDGLSVASGVRAFYRVGRPNGRRIVKIKMKSRDHRNLLLSNARLLRNNPDFQGVYIAADRCFLDRQESLRLRLRAKSLRSDFPKAEIKYTKGKLLVDGLEVDKEDPLAQIFLSH